MAKVYDALRRADAERRRRAGQEAPQNTPLEWEPETSAVVPAPSAPRKGSLFSRLWPGGKRSPLETTGDLNKRRISLLQPDSFVAEQFRALRGRLDAISAQRPLRTLAMTSASPGEGKTTSAINLAIVTSLSVGRRVLLVDCDLRRPKVHSSLGLTPEAGLAEVLTDQIGLDEAIVKPEAMGLEILCVRGRPANPSELLSSARMRELIEEVAQRYDRVILDTPAALGLPDAKAVADLCDGAVVVVRADVTRQEDLEAVLEIVDRRRVLGLVLNGAVADQGRYGYVS